MAFFRYYMPIFYIPREVVGVANMPSIYLQFLFKKNNLTGIFDVRKIRSIFLFLPSLKIKDDSVKHFLKADSFQEHEITLYQRYIMCPFVNDRS
jgi:hypothetical protein